jgi:predicted N-acyltransferase
VELGYRRAASLPSYRLPIRWPSFPAYLAAMRAGYRRQLRQTRASANGAGLSFRSEDFFSGMLAIFELYQQVMERANSRWNGSAWSSSRTQS